MESEHQGLLHGSSTSNAASGSLRGVLLAVVIQCILTAAFFSALTYYVARSYENTNVMKQNAPFFAFQHDNLNFVKDDLTYYYNNSHASVVNNLANQWIAYFDNTFRLGSYTSAQRANMTVVFDIDETSLNNVPWYQVVDYGWDDAGWASWVQNGNATALDGTLTLFRYLAQSGVSATFITGRSLYWYTNETNTYNATAANLRAQGFTPFANLILRTTPAEQGMTADVYKSNHRREIAQSGVQIIGCVGDQVSDCTLGYTGYVMKIPNYIYFIP